MTTVKTKQRTIAEDNLLAIVKNVITALGGLLIGHYFFGAQVTPALWEAIGGFVLSGIGFYLSWKDKEVDIEKQQGLLRRGLSVVGGFLVGTGKLTLEQVNTWIGLIVILYPVILGVKSKQKARQLASGRIQPNQLKGANLKAA